ncbi:hypothetical protein CLAFUW4_02590 [Fulvia fulva]|uniref:Uncharacterized protein n=1 Tax=Passalora fulva TaxID=5499 RepID=A0A9Q8L9I9_PASFU|nr:uncharacterized protein CLAFUR5_02579 [Fulvia fulva]KAK4631958.1 hypothetical protein CLAFUR4_02585 [Fulvia fulva]KAK4632489.1 hypothetical protein CLAFUR0_02587 [Fulvia fulva]UJO13415.1 hypothetical protein CLAFUR5_02579 [Fulvia fulva]WPV10582.1 hypothetical protein CLAFUW4_02590 [Fulvia fulva]WPV25964.1 hypothetical protein CLAFUW7_02590 [Fulvia fulva]
MPPPKSKKTPDKQVDLGAKLAKKRSQDFKDKIQGWNQAGGGILQQQNEVVVIEEREPDPPKSSRKSQPKDDVVQIVVETESTVAGAEAVAVDTKEVRTTTPKTPATPGKGTPKTTGTKKAGRDVDVNRGAWVRRKSKPQVPEAPAEVKHVGTPKKRVVSDGHWRRDKAPKKEESAEEEDDEEDLTPKPIIIRKSHVNVGLRVPPSHQDFAESEPEPEPVLRRPLRQSQSRSRSRSRDGRGATPDYETSGTKVYIKRRRRSRPIDTSESSFTAPSSVDKPSTATDITTPSSSPPNKMNRPVSEPRLRKSKSGEDAPRPKSAHQSARDADGQRITSASKRYTDSPTDRDAPRRKPSTTAEAYARRITEPLKKAAPPVAAVVAPKVHGNRIEGWLNNMPDPFTESRQSSLTPEPLEISKKKSRRRLSSEPEDSAKEEARKSSERRRLARQEAASRDTSGKHSQATEDDFISPSSTPTLKRRGARRKSLSPVKGQRSREFTPTKDDAVMSGALPAASASTSRTTSTATHNDRFRIPSGARPLSTILSVDSAPPPRRDPSKRHRHAYSDDATSIADGSTLSRASDGDSPMRKGSGLKRRATKHDDLMSVLSMSRDDSHPIKSARSVRASRRVRPTGNSATVADLMNELSADELKYQRELRTLVDGVIPVLLQHALSSNEPAPRSRVFSRPANDTTPIVNMGVALERLKNTHKWIPMHEPTELLTWADGASKVYVDYLKAWRMGFKDIVVNLAPAEQDSNKDGAPAWDDGLPRDKNGDLVDAAGERVDVAHLLKRPLVRIKHLAKILAGISQLQPSASAEDMTAKYQKLILDAKARVNEEQARLEDEAAASIDPTRARDPRSLAPITGVSIDPTRSVRARDYFDMDLVHSSGQQLGCKIEIIYRDDAPDRGKAGDLLFCEVSTSGRWLLFPPIPHSLVSARQGDKPSELVVMVRGFLSNARQWREVLSLRTEDDATGADWLQMLGSTPMPPRLTRRSSYNMFKEVRLPTAEKREPVIHESAETPDKSRDPSPREIEVPIGEQAKAASRIWDGSEVNSVWDDDTPTRLRRAKAKRYHSTIAVSTADGHLDGKDDADRPAYYYDRPHAPEQTAKRPVSSYSRSKSDWMTSSTTTGSDGYSVWLPSSGRDRYSDEENIDDEPDLARKPSKRPSMHRRTSSVPSMDMPSIPKLRKASESRPPRPESPSSDRDGLPSQQRAAAERDAEPSSAPAKLQKRRLSMSGPARAAEPDKPPPPPKHRPLSLGLKSMSFTPAFLKKNRRPSSPLKHEYEPSTASDSLSDSDYSDYDDDYSITSESTVDEEGTMDEAVSTVGDLKAFHDYNTRGMDKRPSPPPASVPTLPATSLAPSESASQAPYRAVPPTAAAPVKTVASIFAWAESGSWDSLHPEECQIFITPGLIEAFDLTQANSVSLSADGENSTPSSRGIKPLVALELTPLVPLRRGTAVDISIRSPPTSNSLLRTGANVMFRSRSPDECEKLYGLLNRARIDNPTYIALQNARGPQNQSNWSEVMDRRNNLRTTGKSWWNLGSKKSSSYRSNGSRPLSIAATESSVGTMNSAFSALRRFSGSSRIFNIAKSTITSREGTRSTQSESLSSGTATPVVPLDPSLGTPVGITNAKVRLYLRETAGKWRDLGSARLAVMLPPRPDPSIPANPKTTGLEKRILVYGKSKGEVLLDVTLGETAFERIARTGIAVSVYEETDQVGAVGGVVMAKTTVYMIQMKSERDAAYTFGLVGKLRY